MEHIALNMDIKTDIVIIGAGPAGSMAANVLRDAGKSVVIIDKSNFPRHKSCAGGLTPKTIAELPFDIKALSQHNSDKMLFKFTNGKTVDLNNELGACKMVIREEFDNYFFNFVIKKGADFINSKVEKISEDDEGVVVQTNNETLRCKYLIGADGANSTTRRLITNLKYKNPVFAFEGLVKRENSKKNVPTKFVFNTLG